MRDQRTAPCKPGKVHRFTVMSSKKGWKNCWWCGASAKLD